MHKVAKLFMNGSSQAVRLPIEFRFDAKEVFIRRDAVTGDVILSRRPTDWSTLLEAIKGAAAPPDFLDGAERAQGPIERDPFDGWKEDD